MIYGGIAMKRIISAVLCVVVVLSLFASCEKSEYITIHGKKYNIGLTELDLTNEDLSNKDIVLLKYMSNLTRLTLRGDGINDLTPLTELVNLTDLHFMCNRIRDITPLCQFANLTSLDLTGSQICDITPLSGLKCLTTACSHKLWHR